MNFDERLLKARAIIAAERIDPTPTDPLQREGTDEYAERQKLQHYDDPLASSPPEGLPFGIIDPDYARAYTMIRIAAWQYGYAIGLQGSFTRDLDLIAAPWTVMAAPAEHLVKQIEYRSGLKRQGPPKEQPHGRLSWSLLFPGFEDPRWIDLSVMPIVIPGAGA